MITWFLHTQPARLNKIHGLELFTTPLLFTRDTRPLVKLVFPKIPCTGVSAGRHGGRMPPPPNFLRWGNWTCVMNHVSFGQNIYNSHQSWWSVLRWIRDACDVTLNVYPHRAGLKNMPGHDGNWTCDLWNTSPKLCQLSYAVKSVRVCDIRNRI